MQRKKERKTDFTVLHFKQTLTSNSVFRDNRCPREFQGFFSTAVTLQIRSRSLKSKQFIVMPQVYIQENV